MDASDTGTCWHASVGFIHRPVGFDQRPARRAGRAATRQPLLLGPPKHLRPAPTQRGGVITRVAGTRHDQAHRLRADNLRIWPHQGPRPILASAWRGVWEDPPSSRCRFLHPYSHAATFDRTAESILAHQSNRPTPTGGAATARMLLASTYDLGVARCRAGQLCHSPPPQSKLNLALNTASSNPASSPGRSGCWKQTIRRTPGLSGSST